MTEPTAPAIYGRCPPEWRRDATQRLLKPGELACLTCLILAWMANKYPHRPEHLSRRPSGWWSAEVDGLVPAGTSLRLLDDSWQTFPPVHAGFDSRSYLFRVTDGALAGRHLYANVSVRWNDEDKPPLECMWPDGLRPNDGGAGYDRAPDSDLRPRVTTRQPADHQP